MSNRSSRKKDEKRTIPASKNGSWLWFGLITIGAILFTVVGFTLVRNGRTATGAEAPTATQGGTPRVAVDTAEIDYGEVKMNTPIQAVFNVSNTGDAPLTILERPQVELLEGC